MTRNRVVVVLAAVFLLAGCAGGDDSTDDGTDPIVGADAGDATDAESPDASAATTMPASDDDADDASAVAADTAGAPYEPAVEEFRVINLAAEPVDVYVRTTGRVEGFEIQPGLLPGEMTGYFSPPRDGSVIVTTAGAGDPTCVSMCPHIIADQAAWDDTGDTFTILVHDADGELDAYDLWEETGANTSSANAMVAADPSRGQFIAIAVDVPDLEFGLRVGYVGVDGCIESTNFDGILVGGNQTPAFSYEGDSVEVLLFDNRDVECADAPVGGPFTIAGGPGTRSLLLLTGTVGDLDAIVVPFKSDRPSAGGASATEPTTTTGAASSGSDSASVGSDRDRAVALMAAQISSELSLGGSDAECMAGAVVDAIGVDVALVDGELIDLDTADAAVQNLATEGFIDGITVCDIDPSLLGG